MRQPACCCNSSSAVRLVLVSSLARLLLWSVPGKVTGGQLVGQVHYSSKLSALINANASQTPTEYRESLPVSTSYSQLITASASIWTTPKHTLSAEQVRDKFPAPPNLLPVQLSSPHHFSPASLNQSSIETWNSEPSQSPLRPEATLATPSTFAWSSMLTWDTLLTLVLPYSLIFVMSVVGNILVIVTLSLNRSMRSVTNIFLLNLAISDLLLGVFCMPFTLVGVLLRRFAFGAVMCHLISYLQSVSVAVSVWTLVAMSIERYYAICHPLRSRESRQTLRHAYRMLALVWTLALFCMSPTAIVSQLQLMPPTDNYKCREAWPSFSHREAFTLFLCVSLLVIPLLIMVVTYTSIAIALKQSLRHNSSFMTSNSNKQKCGQKTTTFIKDNTTTTTTIAVSPNPPVNSFGMRSHKKSLSFTGKQSTNNNLNDSAKSIDLVESKKFLNVPRQIRSNSGMPTNIADIQHQTSGGGNLSRKSSNTQLLRVSSSLCTIRARQRRVVLMLCVVVIEFFVCWTPIFIVDTLALYQPALVYGSSRNLSQWLGIDIVSACHLLCFCSSCTNPVTYCFMNNRFRRHFCALFRCRTAGSASVANRAAAAGITQTFVTDNETDQVRDHSGSSFLHHHNHHHHQNQANSHNSNNSNESPAQSSNPHLPVVFQQHQHHHHHHQHRGVPNNKTANDDEKNKSGSFG